MSSPPPATGPALLRYCLSGARSDLLASIGSAFVRQLAFLSVPWILGRAVQAVADDDGAALARWAGLLAITAIVEFAGLCGWIWWANLAEAKLAGTVRGWLLAVALTGSERDLAAESDGYGDLVSRAMDDVDRVMWWIHGLATWIVVATTVVALVPAFAAMDPLLLLVALLVSAGLVVVSLCFPRAFQRRMAAMAAAQAARTQSVVDLLATTVGLRGIGGEAKVIRRHHRASATVTSRVHRVASVKAAWAASADALAPAGVAVGLLFGGLAAVEGRLDVGELTSFALWMGTVQLASQAVVMRLGDRGAARVSADRIAAVLRLFPHRTDAAASAPSIGEPGLALLDVAVPGLATGRVTATVRPGEWLAISGPTGCGKSTLLRAIAGLVPHDGDIRLNGRPASEVPSAQWFDRLTLVPQAPLLLHGTIRANLLLGAPTAGPERDEADLLGVCRLACFDQVLAGLPAGLDTVVGERGATLSGGERQRLALARALLRDTTVLLLDDVSSALDTATETELLHRLRGATTGRVVIWAGHRRAVTEASDRLLALGVGADA